jgi:hypothetical protein
MRKNFNVIVLMLFLGGLYSCTNGDSKNNGALTSNAAEKVYVEPGDLDEYYAFISGGFSGQMSVYGLPSGRLFKVIPVFSQDAEKAWGYNEETKPMVLWTDDGSSSMRIIPLELQRSTLLPSKQLRSSRFQIVLVTTVHLLLPRTPNML